MPLLGALRRKHAKHIIQVIGCPENPKALQCALRRREDEVHVGGGGLQHAVQCGVPVLPADTGNAEHPKLSPLFEKQN